MMRQKSISPSQKIITYLLIGIWFALIGFGIFSTLEPEWLSRFNKTGIEVESRTYKDFGDVSMYKHDFRTAITQYQKALSINSKFVDALVNLAIAYTYTGRYQEAEKLLKDSLRLVDDQTGVINYNLGLLYAKLVHNKEAIDYFQRALGTEMKQGMVYQKLAEIYLVLDQPQEALAALEAALSIQLDPATGYRDMLYHSLVIYDEGDEQRAYIKELLPKEKWQEALSRFDLKIIQEENQHNLDIAKTHAAIADIYREQGNTQMAIQHYRESLKINPNDRSTRAHLRSLE